MLAEAIRSCNRNRCGSIETLVRSYQLEQEKASRQVSGGNTHSTWMCEYVAVSHIWSICSSTWPCRWRGSPTLWKTRVSLKSRGKKRWDSRIFIWQVSVRCNWWIWIAGRELTYFHHLCSSPPATSQSEEAASSETQEGVRTVHDGWWVWWRGSSDDPARQSPVQTVWKRVGRNVMSLLSSIKYITECGTQCDV